MFLQLMRRCTHCNCWEYKSALSVWLSFKNSNNTIVLPLYIQYNFYSMKLHLWGVEYWPPTRPGCQNRKCTCVNNRCTRSRNIRIITLTVDRLNESEIVKPTRRRLTMNYYITQCTGNSISWGSDELKIRCGRENQHPAEWAPRPPVEQPRRTGKKRGYGQ